MTGKTAEAARDCISKIRDSTPADTQIKGMLSFLSVLDGLAEVCTWEGPSGLRLEADRLSEDTGYEKVFKESIRMWLDGAGFDEASDHAADKYFEENPAGYDAALYFAAVFGAGKILKGEHGYSFIDQALQYLLPDGWRWREENEKEKEAHKDDPNWSPLMNDHRGAFLGDREEDMRHRFDTVRTGNLINPKDPVSEAVGKRIADRLPDYKDGALQLILKELTLQDLENALYVLPEAAEERIMSNISDYDIPIIKGDCILNKDSVSPNDIHMAVMRLEAAIDAYDGDFALEADYKN